MKIEETIILLEKLNQLKEKGVLTQEEFNNKKLELLRRESSIIQDTPKENIANMIKAFFYRNWKTFLIIFVIIVLIFISKHIMPQHRFEKSLQKVLISSTLAGITGLFFTLINRANNKKIQKQLNVIDANNKITSSIKEEKHNTKTQKKQDNVDFAWRDIFIPIVGILGMLGIMIAIVILIAEVNQYHSRYTKEYQEILPLGQRDNNLQSKADNVDSETDKKIYSNKSNVNNKLQSKVDYINSEINNKIYKNKSNEELYEELKKQVKDNEITGISAYNGFVISAQVIKEYCSPTGYIPNNFIKKINNYKKNIDVENRLKDEFIKLGATKEQSNILVKTMLEETKNNLSILMDRDYNEFKKEDASLSKKAYCKLYDSMADEMIQNRINIVKNTTPKAYEKYFKH